jgi:hypothetical protein
MNGMDLHWRPLAGLRLESARLELRAATQRVPVTIHGLRPCLPVFGPGCLR